MTVARGDEAFTVRPPQQKRTREAWIRVLEAGVSLLEESGPDGFTLSAVCARARVAPSAVYARAPTKEALVLAVYEHGMESVLASQARIHIDRGLERDRDLVRRAVADVAQVVLDNARFLRAVVLMSGARPEIASRGRQHLTDFGALFADTVSRVDRINGRADRDAALRSAFSMIVSSMVIRVSYGADFTGPAVADDVFVETLASMVELYLLPDGE